MDNEYFARIESKMDALETRLRAAELALTQIPQINFEVDPSRPAGVRVEPAALGGK